MAKRKMSCGNARMCSMLLTNVTQSASYEALPNHRLFPARSGLTSRFRLRHRCLRHLSSNKSGDAVGRPSCRSSLLVDPGAKFLMETGDPNRTVKNSLNYVSTCLRVVDTRRSTRNSCAVIQRGSLGPLVEEGIEVVKLHVGDMARVIGPPNRLRQTGSGVQNMPIPVFQP